MARCNLVLPPCGALAVKGWKERQRQYADAYRDYSVSTLNSGWKNRRPVATLVNSLLIFGSLLMLLTACSGSRFDWAKQDPDTDPLSQRCRPENTVYADIVAIEQAYILNRFAAFVPAGMLYALKHDVVALDESLPIGPGNAVLHPNKRPRPLVLRVNEGDCLEVSFENWLADAWREAGSIPREYGNKLPAHVQASAGTKTSRALVPANKVSIDAPRTRSASFHITGLDLAPIPARECPLNTACNGDGMNVGVFQGITFNPSTSLARRDAFNLGSLAKPGQRVVTRWYAQKEGTYFAYSSAAPVGGEGDGGQIGLGLFAAVTVEPKGSRWYRSQVTHEQLDEASTQADGAHSYAAIDYETRGVVNGVERPILAMLDEERRLVHSDLNAIVVLPEGPGMGRDSERCKDKSQHMYGDACGRSFREFTVIMHDEIHAKQAFAELEDEDNPLHYLKDGMGINYGASGLGSAAISTPLQRKVGVVKDCPECRLEEFFLTSWANGDPALILKYDAAGQNPVGARYPDDPSNVHHSYLGDTVRFRNLHAGPKETHVFHLHAHQWVLDESDPNSTYVDSQTISPGAAFSYGIEFGGSGNRNYTPGDSIFHCHLYPHFAQGMWELWRVHDVFEDGNYKGLYNPEQPAGEDNDPRWRNLPDAEVAGGVQSPAVIPIPGAPLAPLPSELFAGYPFYIPGKPGHRPPQAPLDIDQVAGEAIDGGLPRHVIASGTLITGRDDPQVRARALAKGGEAAQVIARRVAEQDPIALNAFAAEWDRANLIKLPHAGTPQEQIAMRFHEGALSGAGLEAASTDPGEWWSEGSGYKTEFAATLPDMQTDRQGPALFRVNGLAPKPGAPYANPCPPDAPVRDYRTAFIQTELTYNKHGWFDPQGRIVILENDIKEIIDPATRTRLPEPFFFRANSGECIDFKTSNFVPSALNADDFQIYTPTDTIGQHIHLVKFDVTASDGSGNGWNYEDGTFSPDEVRERIFAYNRTLPHDSPERLAPKAHPLFRAGGDIWKAAQGDVNHPVYGALLNRGLCPEQKQDESEKTYEHRLASEHPLCGAQRTTQRWWADPIVNQVGRDNTLRTVFTHDHFGPSSHQQHGLYAGLVIEPANSVWTRVNAQLTRDDLATAGDELGCDLPPGKTGRTSLCDKLIGGSDLSRPTVPALRREQSHPLSPIEPREPLKLRNDGGPTATLANIIAPKCAGDGDSNPLQPVGGMNRPRVAGACTDERTNDQTRREFTLAIADFGIAYNAALEPINPEPRGKSNNPRDKSKIRFGHRQVALNPARPLGISSEDPGTQFVNYRHEPVALRIAEVTGKNPANTAVDPTAALGGFEYSQSARRAFSSQTCEAGDQDCLGDPANAFSTEIHAGRDERLAKQPQKAHVSRTTRELLKSLGSEPLLDKVLADVEQWRRDFNCALYDESLMPEASAGQPGCRASIARQEPWRVFGDPATPILPAYDGDQVQIRLIQGAQEAQHVFTMNGVKWLRKPGSRGSGYTHAQPLGISEHFEFDIQIQSADVPYVDYFYHGSSIDQLWDGMWGALRSFSRKPERGSLFTSSPDSDQAASEARGQEVSLSDGNLAKIDFGGPKLIEPIDKRNYYCTGDIPRRFYDVSAVLVCQLAGEGDDNAACDSATSKGIPYNTRADLYDPLALVYLLNTAASCADGAHCDELESQAPDNDQTLESLRQRYAGRLDEIEPLTLRAAANDCLYVLVRNHLPAEIKDGPSTVGPSTVSGGQIPERSAYANSLPMITDGFNLNQFRMSSSIGLSAPRVAQNPLWDDASSVGVNSAVRVAAQLRRDADGRERQSRSDSMQGSLIPPCRAGDRESRCKRRYIWRAAHTAPGQPDQALELGAVPLRSFGDPVKHPTHGLIGALVIGPEGSAVCANNRYANTRLSADICEGESGRFLYVDHVLNLQDAVSAMHGELPAADLSGAQEPDDYGVKAVNYRTEPLWARRGNDPSLGFSERNKSDYSTVFSSQVVVNSAGKAECAAGIRALPTLEYGCDPETPILTTRAGEPMRLHFVHSGGHTRQQGLAVSGHQWNPYPWSADSLRFDAHAGSSYRQGVYNGFGPMMGVSLELQAGGANKVPMDYLIQSQASYLLDGGTWGLLRVTP